MAAAQHTPGPWEECGHLVRTVRTGDGGGYLVAEVPANSGHTLADARLIAAAPGLLAYVRTRADAGDAEAQRLVVQAEKGGAS